MSAGEFLGCVRLAGEDGLDDGGVFGVVVVVYGQQCE